LIIEGGLNDGLALPFVTILLALAEQQRARSAAATSWRFCCALASAAIGSAIELLEPARIVAEGQLPPR
jgi:NhaP-type Na+/H+ or K+/H+ antiporter